MQNGDFSQGTTGWSAAGVSFTVNNGEVTLTVNTDILAAKFIRPHPNLNFIQGHKYYYAGTLKNISASGALLSIDNSYSNASLSNVFVTGTEWQRVSNIYTYSDNVSSLRFCIRIHNNQKTGVQIAAKDIICVNLTALYGKGNEPTVAEFEAQYPDDYYPYCPL